MARFYADENFPLPTVEALRELGHDVLTMVEDGLANQRVTDSDVLRVATSQSRVLLTLNRRDFIRLHDEESDHSGIVACTIDPDFRQQATSIDRLVQTMPKLRGRLLRVNRPLS
ncbi:MAG: DUF5615 family PIN-like protein [Anaerolineales bacterium]|nr:DUF5615 family PIN-like protein [Anaerolineales bacterium]MCB9129023.1 DUF5615 family PIN-like protein [Ardenticatenales bacterium]